MGSDMDDHDRGLSCDLTRLLDRRGVLRLMAGAGLVTMVGCANGSDEAGPAATTTTPTAAGATPTTAGSATTTAGTATGNATCQAIPAETAGPFPGDGSNGPNVLNQAGVVRSDIRSSFGSPSTSAAGVPLTITLTIEDRSRSCAALAGAAVYLWHCDRDGLYSLYSSGVTNQNYLRGVQEAAANGRVTFQSVFPGCYAGRWPHIHFEVYPTLASATSVTNRRATSQLALPKEVCDTVYATTGYGASARNLSGLSLERDNVFSDGFSRQLATTGGTTGAGITANLRVPV